MEGMLSPADVAVLSGARNNNGSNGGFGDMGAWWIIIFLIFAFGGWGNGGFGGNGGGSSMQGALTRGDLCMDMNFQELQNAVRNISDGVSLGFANLNSTICNQQYDTARMINGIENTILTGNFGLQTAINGVGTQLQSCCCDIRQGLSEMNFNNAQNTCAITNSINNGIRDVLENCNANYRALHDEIIANRIEDKNAQIAAQQSEINKLQLAASQQAQNAYLVSELGPKQPVPAYPVFPTTSFAYPTGVAFGINGLNGYNGYNNGCGCGCC